MSGSGVTVYADDFNTCIATENGDGVVFGPSMQPALAIKDGYLVLASSPEAV